MESSGGAWSGASTQNRLNQGGVYRLGYRRIIRLGLIYRGRQVITERLYLWTGPSVGSQIIGLISNEANSHYAGWGLYHINVPHGHSCRPAQLKNHAREGVSSSGREGPLVYHRL